MNQAFKKYPHSQKSMMWKIKYDEHNNRNVKTKLDRLKKCMRKAKKWTEKAKHASDSISSSQNKLHWSLDIHKRVHYLRVSNTKEF